MPLQFGEPIIMASDVTRSSRLASCTSSALALTPSMLEAPSNAAEARDPI